MGLVIKADIETSSGPTKKAYVRIDNYRVDKVTSRLRFAVSYWRTKESAHNFNRLYLEENLKNATGLFSSNIVFYESKEDEGKEVSLPTFFDINMASEEVVEEPVFEMKDVTKTVPFISFDENGDEITLQKEVTKKEKVQVDVVTSTKNKINNSIIGDLPKYCYNEVKKQIQQLLPNCKIEND